MDEEIVTRVRRLSWFLITFAVVCALALAPAPRVSIRTHGSVAMNQADVWLTITMTPEPDDRTLIIEVLGSPGEYRRSDRALEGLDSAQIRQVYVRSLGPGCYYFAAAIADNSKVIATAVTQLPYAIIGFEGNPCPRSE